MNINYKQPQFELFPANTASLEDVNKPRFLLANLTLSLESLVILSILGIMIGLFSFAVGVERGKYIAAQALDEKISAVWNLQKRPEERKTAVLPQAKGNGGFITTSAIKPKVPTKAAPLAGSRFTVQVATYKNKSFAQKQALDLKAKGGYSFLIKKGDLYLVCVGLYDSADKAAINLKKLQAKYRGSQLRRF